MERHEQMHDAEDAGQAQEQVDTAADEHENEESNEPDAYDYDRELSAIDEHENKESDEPDAYDYDREPPLDSVTTSSNRRRSKYVFMTLCFLLALIFLYTYLTNNGSGDWFPLVGAIVLGIVGVIFLRSPDSPPEIPPVEGNAAATDADTPAERKPAKPLNQFEELVQEALATIPEEFHEKMENVIVQVEYEPDEETRTRVGVQEGHTLLGLYEGVPLTAYGRHYAPYPETITIYQRPIEDYCRHNPTRIREQVRTTVLHEVAHHFGMGHEEMPIWAK